MPLLHQILLQRGVEMRRFARECDGNVEERSKPLIPLTATMKRLAYTRDTIEERGVSLIALYL
jgi:hypothetical protein